MKPLLCTAGVPDPLPDDPQAHPSSPGVSARRCPQAASFCLSPAGSVSGLTPLLPAQHRWATGNPVALRGFRRLPEPESDASGPAPGLQPAAVSATPLFVIAQDFAEGEGGCVEPSR